MKMNESRTRLDGEMKQIDIYARERIPLYEITLSKSNRPTNTPER